MGAVVNPVYGDSAFRVERIQYATLEHVAMQARPYPTHLLEGCDTGLCLFAAAFLGHNDAIHMAEAGMQGTCVDTDETRLFEMRDLYPRDWLWLTGDAWTTAQMFAAIDETWDVVSLDPFTNQMAEVLASRDLWCSLAERYVVMGVPADIGYVSFPHGWKVIEFMERSSIASWLVVEKTEGRV